MARTRRKTTTRLAAVFIGAVALLSALGPASAQTARIACSTSSLCPESAPCCSSEGVCGSGAMQCAGGCNPMSSFKPSSCLPNPVCRSRQLTIAPSDYNSTSMFTPILTYNGNASTPFTLDAGTLGPGPEGVLLQLRAAQQAKISTTDYLMYGYVEATLRHNARQGLIAAFITMSDIKDEIDIEFGKNSSVLMSNYFHMGQGTIAHAADLSPAGLNVSDWHTYGLNWTSTALQWSVDGRIVRTLTRNQAGDSYPRSPARIQFSTWAGGNATNPEGTIEWAGGLIDWDTPEYKEDGYYWQEIKQFNVQCAPLSGLNLTSVAGASGGNVTSFVYTGNNSTTTGEPEFGTSSEALRTLADPAADGYPGYPGWDAANSKTDKDGKDGKSNSDGDGNDKNDKDLSVSTSQVVKYALPISGAIIGLGLLWALIAFIRKRSLRPPMINAIGVTGVHDSRFTGPSSRFSKPINAAYQDLEHEAAPIYRTEPNMNLMVGGGFMSDAGLSHLQRQSTAGSKVSRSSTRSLADRLLRKGSKAKSYQQVQGTVDQDKLLVQGSRFSAGPDAYHFDHAYQSAQQVDDEYEDEQRYGAPRDYYEKEEDSFEACQLQSPQRRALPITPYTPNYAPSPAAPQLYYTGAYTPQPAPRYY
ncbi:Glycoside hydrolase, family 16 [Kalmanozyma brasiliensis GHG001]|uniref:GH16 domain-containing protein n=1 Tax=Kalmanozyma brasiliensis (strain GHG001) TaxID=1365824 RepID=V5EHT9_KALBG|nr:Glycoside hydrolase, family 16 [Kalmanozyma brasiliensis GHG001]EST10166.1 Glycoside hydrolase, family 16 [Kalmanozyma brasiliensis GHG001]